MQSGVTSKKGDAVQSVAESVDTVNRKTGHGLQAAKKTHIEDDAQRSDPTKRVNDLGRSPCTVAGITDRRLSGRPGPSISLQVQLI
ncbi:hypothetical protein [Paraburkholderia sp. BCC1884]|uniref:hypothetical protein n=1 Tax=Paraburkholderia sp. BCC1884 TaxID=2562668 RepID=UPI001182F4E7|nr:hypothetical protein [Paraburkholderia sp. BCC1884]